MKIDTVMSLDLEMTQPSRKIIQIGITVGSIRTGEIYERIRYYINVDEKLTDYIINLTGITDKQIDKYGIPLLDAYNNIASIHKTYNCFINPIVFGIGDSELLRKQLNLVDDDDFIFGRRSLDVKTLYTFYAIANNKKNNISLSKIIRSFGLSFVGRPHDACDDAENTFLLLRHLFKIGIKLNITV